jgi:hypothetical protein
MGRYINTALGQRWTDLPLDDDIHLSERHKEARRAAYETSMEKMGGAKAPPSFTQQDAFDLAELLAREGTSGLPHGSHIETTSLEVTTPLQRPYGRVYTTVATSITILSPGADDASGRAPGGTPG